MKKYLLILVLLGVSIGAWSQSVNQNCLGAIPICQPLYNQSIGFNGVGTVNELNGSNQGCLTTGENNSVWYILSTSSAGTLVFTITPNGGNSDYDFAVWDLTDKSCDAISAGLQPVRCNYASLANSTAGGLTGLALSATSPSYGASGPSFSAGINVSAGQTFVILINNSSASNAGYTLNFSGSTCQIAGNTAPYIKGDTLPPTCGGPTSVKVLLSENITCSSLASNGSDFHLNPAAATITGASSSVCNSGGSFSNVINLNFSNPLPPGTYTLSLVTGSDGNTLLDNCGNAATVGGFINFTVYPDMGITIGTQFGCAGTPSGVITANPVGGMAPYAYRINGGTYTYNNMFSGLYAGTYTITIRDNNGCTHDTTVALAQGTPIVMNNVTVTNLTCFGVNTGMVQVSASGGLPPLTFSEGFGAYGTSGLFTNMSPGNHIMHIKDLNGCVVDTVVFISSPGQLSLNNLTLTAATCGLNNGAIQVISYGGVSPLQYALNSNPYNLTGLFSNLNPGVYTLHIKDANNCHRDSILNVPSISLLSLSAPTITQPLCFGGAGNVVINATGGSTPYTYSLDGINYTTNSLFPNLNAGAYTVTVKDVSGCTATQSWTINAPAGLVLGVPAVTNASCTSLGSVALSANGGSLPYTFALGSGSYSSTPVFSSLAAGNYTLHVKDANGCSRDTVITLTTVPVPHFDSLIQSNPTCSFPVAGTITVGASGGSGILTYSINASSFNSQTFFSGLSSGYYTIVVTDANSCTASTTTLLTSSNTLSFTTFSHTNVGCQGSPLGTISAQLSTGNPPYHYSLNGGVYYLSGTFNGLNAGIFTVTGKDASGCTITSIAQLSSSATLGFNSVVTTNSPCYTPGTGSITPVASGSAPPLSISLSGNSSSWSVPPFNNLSPGLYTLSVQDANGCHVDSLISISGAPPMYYVNVHVVNTPCYGGYGSITLTGAGGVAPYSYSLSGGPFTANSNWPNLYAGSYTIRVKDANGCWHDTTINLLQPTEMKFSSFSVMQASCNGTPTGSISFTVLNGVPPYTYSLNNGTPVNTPQFINLNPGVYVIQVTDSVGCHKDTTVTITNNGNFSFSQIQLLSPSCINNADGTIGVQVNGGNLPYTYALNNGTYGTTSLFTGLSAAVFTIHAKDNSGCSADSIVLLPAPAVLSFSSISLTAPSCYNSSNGAFQLYGAGGAGGYAYRVDGGAFALNNLLNGYSAGTHTVSVMDQHNCIKDSLVQMTAPSPLYTGYAAIQNPGCTGMVGQVTIPGAGGTSPYTYSIGNGPFSAQNLFSNLNAVTYVFHVQDSHACITDTTITLFSNPVIAIQGVDGSPLACVNGSNGYIHIQANTINPPLLYSMNGGASQTSSLFNGLGVGTYNVHMADQAGCYMDTMIAILPSPPVQISQVIINPAICHSSPDGSLQVSAIGGTGTLHFALNASAYTSTSGFNNLISGNYTLHVQDSLQCETDSIISVGAPPALTCPAVNFVHPHCSIATDGVLMITANGGQPPYLYAINNSLYTTNNVFQNLIQGTYTIHIRDFNNCLHDTTVELDAANYMNFINVNVVPVSCKYGNDGSISLTAAGGLNPYTYTLNAFTNGTVSTFLNLGAGMYTIGVTDLSGCQADTVIEVAEPSFPVHAGIALITTNLCRGDSIGSIQMAGNGGYPPYLYSIDGSTFQSSMVFTGLLAGAYQLTIKDQHGCLDDTTGLVLEPDTSVQLFLLNQKDVSCVDVNDGQLVVTSKYGAGLCSYYLNNNLLGTDTFYHNLAPGNYIVEVHDSLGCRSTGKFSIQPSDRRPFIILDDEQGIKCTHDHTGGLLWHTINTFPPYYYTFDSVYIGTQHQKEGLGKGIYSLTVVDSVGCHTDTTFSLQEADPMAIQVVASPASCNGMGDDGKAVAIVTGGERPFSFFWYGSIGNSTDHAEQLVYGEQLVYVTDGAGCRDSVPFTIAYDPCCKVNLPNAFSPNGDGINDVFRLIKSGNITLLSFEVYNRWGNQVYATTMESDGWDGMYHGTHCDADTYFYLVKYRCHLNNETILLKGDVVLIR